MTTKEFIQSYDRPRPESSLHTQKKTTEVRMLFIYLCLLGLYSTTYAKSVKQKD